jgi:hypothetical protein
MTTSTLAKDNDVLQRVGGKIMLCEEAGEVLDAHTVTAFLEGSEHAILIGDHEELRPRIKKFNLSLENTRANEYFLDISLFERLVWPGTGSLRIPFSTLRTQRRIHPSISDLTRDTIYPDPGDYPLVAEYPQVTRMGTRLCWLDHQVIEDTSSTMTISSSKTN